MRERHGEYLKFFLIYLLLTCLYFHKIFIDGIIILNGDSLLWNYPVREFYAEAIKSFTLPLWNPYEYAGLPFIGQMQTAALYPPNLILYFLLPAPYAFNASFILHYSAAGLFTFMYLRALGLRKLPAFAGGIVFSLSGFLIDHKPHTAILDTAAWLPLILYYLERLRQTVDFRYAAFAALAVGVQLLAGNFQICFYTDIVLMLFFAYYTVTAEGEKRARFATYCAAAIVLGFAVASSQIYSVMEVSKFTFRSTWSSMLGHEFPALYHVYISTLPSLFFPYLYSSGGYGATGMAAPEDMMIPFVGAAATVLALSALVMDRKNLHVRFWGIVALVGLLLALGSSTPLSKLLYNMPVFRDMRSHGRNLMEFSLALSVLMSVGLDGIFHGEKARRYLKTCAIGFGGVLAIAVAALLLKGVIDTGGLADYLGSLEYQNPVAILKGITIKNPAVWIPMAFITLYLAWCVIYMKKDYTALKFVIVALILAESFSFGGFHEMSGPKLKNLQKSYDMDMAYNYVYSFGLNRVFKVSSTKAGASLYNVPRGVGSVNSYDQFSFESYIRLLELNTVGLMPREENQLELLLKNNILLSALNTRFIIVPRGTWLPGLDAVSGTRVPEAHEVKLNWTATGGLAKTIGAYVFPSHKGAAKASLGASASLEPGTYYLSFKSRRTGSAKSTLNVQIDYPPVLDRRFRMGVLTASTDHAEKAAFEAPKGDYRISFSTDASSAPIEMTIPKLVRVAPYAPLLNNPDLRGTRLPLYQPVFNAANYLVYENVNALPRAFMVEEVEPVRDFAALNERFYTLQVDPALEALLYTADARNLEGGLTFSPGVATVTRYGPNRVEVQTDAPGRGFLVLSDQYYRGWRAYVDGRATRIYETNGVMRGVVVPPGKHVVSFRYLPLMTLSLLGLGILLASGLLCFAFLRRHPSA